MPRLDHHTSLENAAFSNQLSSWSRRCGLLVLLGGTLSLLSSCVTADEPTAAPINPQPAVSVNTSNDKVASWHFNDSTGSQVSDETGINNGAATGTSIVTGYLGFGRAFRGSGLGDYVTVPDNPSLRGMSQIVVEAWVYPTSFDLGCFNGDEAVVIKGHDTGGLEPPNLYALRISRNYDDGAQCASSFRTVRFGFEIATPSGGSAASELPDAHQPSHWYYVVGTYDGSVTKLFVNGSLVATGNVSPGLVVTTTDSLAINYHRWLSGASNGRMGGVIDEVAISNSVRSNIATQIQSTYRQATHGKGTLSFPLAGCAGQPCTVSTAPVAAIVDHSLTTGYYARDVDGIVRSFHGEIGLRSLGYNLAPSGFRQDLAGTPFTIPGLNYVGASSVTCYDGNGVVETCSPNASYLNYRGHSGYDYPCSEGVDAVLAADDGMLSVPTSDAVVYGDPTTFNAFVITHASGLETWYLHSQPGTVVHAGKVKKGDVVAKCGAVGVPGHPHLHFEVRDPGSRVKGLRLWTTVVDPYFKDYWQP